MAYIGVQPRLGNFQACDAITTSSTATFNLLVGGTAIFPQSAQHCLVSLNGVLQAPISSYTISGSTIVFASALTSADSIDFITILGDTLDLGTPSDSTVTSAKLNTALLTGATDIGAAIADADLFLVDDGAGGTLRKTAASRIKTYVGGGITMADQWRITANHTSSGDITSNWERVDNTGWGGIGTGMTESSGVFTFPSTGVYSIRFTCQGSTVSNDNINGYIKVATDGSSFSNVARANFSATDGEFNASSTEFLFDVTNVSTHKAKMRADSIDSGSAVTGSTSQSETFVTFVRLADT